MPRRATKVVLSEKEEQGLRWIQQATSERTTIGAAGAHGVSDSARTRQCPDRPRLGQQCGHGAPVARSVGGTARD